ncbi:helix-turn-helix domain-containing protein [Streptosporangium sp. NPDC000396]|uniref:helix-turn-helix domain-containing protein n=1 Tax=Streptosporangium sp. NPDC000396 TaxID=3366185 RepID=UPI0036D1734E
MAIAEREEVSRGLAAGHSARAITRQLGHSASTVSREIARNGGRERYRAQSAEDNARRRACRPKPAKLARHPQLRRLTQEDLDGIAAELNNRPRRIHGFRSPAEVYADLIKDGDALVP